MRKIAELAQLFAKYKIYPKKCYNDRSPTRVFQKMFPENHYSEDLETFLSHQNYEPTKRGADLPWWGRKFFTDKKGLRILIVSQDSEVEGAGSITLFAQLFQVIENREQYKEFVRALGGKGAYGFRNRMRVKEQLSEWNIDLDLLYITDASKVYKEGSWKNFDFDRQKSKELLEREIEFCNPSLIILLGGKPLFLLDKTKKFSEVVESGKPILIKGVKCVVSPFITGQGIAHSDFKPRMKITTPLIQKSIAEGLS